MNTDLYLVIGIIVVALAIPAVFAAYSEGRVPRAASILVLIGGSLVVMALTKKPGGLRCRTSRTPFTGSSGN